MRRIAVGGCTAAPVAAMAAWLAVATADVVGLVSWV